MTGKCQTIALTEAFDKIKASNNPGVPGINLSFYRRDKKKTYGVIGKAFTDWKILKDKPLIGIYGR